jgi:FtsZ-interacting cell division protein ZipA
VSTILIVIVALALLALLSFGGKRKRQKGKADKHLELRPMWPGARNPSGWSLSTIGSVLVRSTPE